MLSRASHCLIISFSPAQRTPCYSIQTSTALLARVPAVAADAEAMGLLKHVSASCAVLDGIISNVLSMQADRKGTPLHIAQSVFDPRTLLAGVADALANLCANRTVVWPAAERDALPPATQGDAPHLGGCLHNLLFTAVRFGSWEAPGAVRMHVSLQPLPPAEHGTLLLRVTLDSPGRALTNEECDALFEPFGLAPADKVSGVQCLRALAQQLLLNHCCALLRSPPRRAAARASRCTSHGATRTPWAVTSSCAASAWRACAWSFWCRCARRRRASRPVCRRRRLGRRT
jgi:K+-sensing histidine kinase KdpD